MFGDDFVDLDLRFKNKRRVENMGVDFEIGDITTYAHWYWRSRKFHAEPVCFFITFIVTSDLYFQSLITTFL